MLLFVKGKERFCWCI